MYLIGNSTTLTGQDGMWRDIVGIFEEHKSIGPTLQICCQNHPDTRASIATPEDFQRHACDGGCSLPCQFRMECGHVCPKMCHPGGHDSIRCVQLCRRTPPGCPFQHACTRLCHQECGQCNVEVDDVLLPCGHSNTLPCWQAADPQPTFCRELITIVMPCCYHKLKIECGKRGEFDEGLSICEECCNQPLKCKHPCQSKCGKCVKLSAERLGVSPKSLSHDKVDQHEDNCNVKCTRPLVNLCGHPCNEPCHEFFGSQCGLQTCKKPCTLSCDHSSCKKLCGVPCIPCVEPCRWYCEHQGRCELVCSAPCVRLPCNLRCSKLLPCRHVCPGVCGEDCSLFKRFCVECSQDESLLSTVVDLISFQTLGEVDLDANPLIAFPCGKHVLCVDSADDGNRCRLCERSSIRTICRYQVHCRIHGIIRKQTGIMTTYIN
jgi:hypothetical protein